MYRRGWRPRQASGRPRRQKIADRFARPERPGAQLVDRHHLPGFEFGLVEPDLARAGLDMIGQDQLVHRPEQVVADEAAGEHVQPQLLLDLPDDPGLRQFLRFEEAGDEAEPFRRPADAAHQDHGTVPLDDAGDHGHGIVVGDLAALHAAAAALAGCAGDRFQAAAAMPAEGCRYALGHLDHRTARLMPPSTRMFWPVMAPAPSDSRKASVSAISVSLTGRPIGVAFCTTSASGQFSTKPGITLFMRMPSRP